MKKNSFNLVILLIIAISISGCSTEENVYTIKKSIKNTLHELNIPVSTIKLNIC